VKQSRPSAMHYNNIVPRLCRWRMRPMRTLALNLFTNPYAQASGSSCMTRYSREAPTPKSPLPVILCSTTLKWQFIISARTGTRSLDQIMRHRIGPKAPLPRCSQNTDTVSMLQDTDGLYNALPTRLRAILSPHTSTTTVSCTLWWTVFSTGPN